MTRPLAGLTWRNAGREILAGVTLLAIAVPLNIGYAQIAGLPPTAGLYALVVPAVVYALVVSSRQVVASPDAAAAALVASSVGGLAVAGSADYAIMAFAQAIISGVLFVLASVFKLGFLASFLSKPILVGFVGGLALDILVSQIAKMLGVKIDSGGEFVDKIAGLITGLGAINGWSVAIAAASIAVLVVGRRIARMIPWALLVLVVTTVIVVTTGLEQSGVAVLGPVEAGPPSLTWPILDWGTWLALVPSAIALTMVTMAEGLLVARSYGDKRGYRTQPNRDLLAFGLGNIASGATGGFAVGSSTSRTAAMDQAGSRTQLPSLVAAVGTLLLLVFGTGLLEHIPSPAIGAVVGVAILPLLGIGEFRRLWRQDRFEFVIGAVCFLATLFIGAIPGIVIAFVLALVNLAKRASTPAIDVLAPDGEPGSSLLDPAPAGTATAPGVVVIRLAAPLFFANGSVFSDAVQRAVTTAPDVRHVVLDLEAVTDIDVTGAETFETLTRWLTDRHVSIAYSRPRQQIIDRMRTLGLISDEPIYRTNREALTALSAQAENP
ncbi:sodium-independent anion transporter [Cnuibacter physcomitrellae]|uniref:Sodium-independent anion transporter n=1 Tax=Cnuibacter physcomitrellae TaxID=1619308 RepID=A0A1X9LPS1_9MICO|nr:SulP family inorganic anion transporter [Cnuibacter physcomitrellae]ARJ03880.1 sodium-independent anion transporter [Cnuibacter physcomitrellae]GGI39718.1 sodium-independent anion transporter [Cnuibacter physcomitrellae]